MNNVYLHAAIQSELLRDDFSALKSIPLWRRMTPLQKVVLSAMHKAMQTHKPLLERLSALEAPLYFTSAFGEVGAMLRVTQSLEENSLPISPKDFQHSVLNAALSYLAIEHKLHQAGFAISGGFASADVSLHLAARRIAAGLDAGAIVIHGHENGGSAGDNARAELLIIAAEFGHGASHSMNFIDQSYDLFVQSPAPADDTKIYAETEGSIAWLLHEGKLDLKRSVKTRQGLTISTQWQELK